MKTKEAIRLYNKAEEIIKQRFTGIIERGIRIDELLEKLYGDEVADEILELVFESEFPSNDIK